MIKRLMDTAVTMPSLSLRKARTPQTLRIAGIDTFSNSVIIGDTNQIYVTS
jgi:hypothetical protein